MKRARVSTLLLVAIIGVNAYIIALPVLPVVGFWFRSNHSSAASALQEKVRAAQPAPGSTEAAAIKQAGSRILIPSMLLDEPFYTGKDERTLNKGLWLRPTGSTPDKGGNTVIVGHRFTYANPRGTLYFLDKMRVGDNIALYWQGKKYVYTVKEIGVVPDTATEIETPTDKPRLTIYTCTPLWNPVDRLVVIADLVEEP